MRSTRGIAYGRNADDRRWKNGRSVRREPVVKLSSYLRLHELRAGNFPGFVKIADGGARGETLERLADIVARRVSSPTRRDRESSKKKKRGRGKAREREAARETREIRVFHARGSVARSSN